MIKIASDVRPVSGCYNQTDRPARGCEQQNDRPAQGCRDQNSTKTETCETIDVEANATNFDDTLFVTDTGVA